MAELLTLEAPPDRAAVLRPIINQLLQLVYQRGEQGGTLKISVGPHAIEVTSWERAQLLPVAAGAEKPNEIARALLEGVAAQARALNNLVRLGAIADDNLEQKEQCRRDLVQDLALLHAVRLDAERVARELNDAGKPGQARYLEAFVERFDGTLETLKGALSQEEVGTAAALAAGLQRTAQTQDGGPAGTEARDEDSADAADARPQGLRPRHAVLASFATIVLVFGVLVGLPLATQRYELADGFRYIAGVEAWNGTPPTITVTVEKSHWDALTAADRMAMVFGIAAAIQKKGFTQADVVDGSGKVLARWDKVGGVTQ